MKSFQSQELSELIVFLYNFIPQKFLVWHGPPIKYLFVKVRN